jgi:Mg2+/citrate symporter
MMPNTSLFIRENMQVHGLFVPIVIAQGAVIKLLPVLIAMLITSPIWTVNIQPWGDIRIPTYPALNVIPQAMFRELITIIRGGSLSQGPM